MQIVIIINCHMQRFSINLQYSHRSLHKHDGRGVDKSKNPCYNYLDSWEPWTQMLHLDLVWHMDRVKRIWYLSPMRAAKVQASLRIRAVSPEPPLLAHTSSESRGTFRQKTRSLAPLNDWACAVKVCHDGMLEDTNSLGAAHIIYTYLNILSSKYNRMYYFHKKILCSVIYLLSS